MSVLGVVLAGGASRRMGEADKVLLQLGRETLLQRAVRKLAPQVARVVVNGPAALAEHCDVDVLPDTIEGRVGPLAGVLAGLEGGNDVLTVAVDSPFFPGQLQSRMVGDGVGIARCDGQLQPVFGYWPAATREAVAKFLNRGDRKIMLLAEALEYRAVDFDAGSDPFFNINTPDDLSEARRRIEVEP